MHPRGLDSKCGTLHVRESVTNDRLQLYLPDQKQAIELNENSHADRDKHYAQEREQAIIGQLGCRFMRNEPDSIYFQKL